MNDKEYQFVAQSVQGGASELPTADDLQIAAAAAAATFHNDADSDDSDTSSDKSESSGDGVQGMPTSDDDTSSSGEEDNDGTASIQESITLILSVSEDTGLVMVEFQPHYHLHSSLLHHDLGIEHIPIDEGSSSDQETSEDDEDIEEIGSYEELRNIIDAMDDYDDTSGVGAGGGNSMGRSAAEELFGNVPVPSLTGTSVGMDDVLIPAGSVLSVIEGTIVVRAAPGSRALNEGSVLVLEDRTVIGTVEDIFGPVQAPLYAMRYCGGGDGGATGPDASTLPELLTPQAAVFSVERLSSFVLAEELRVKGYDADEGDGVDGAEAEQHFSDDEAVSEVLSIRSFNRGLLEDIVHLFIGVGTVLYILL